jgi:hypothetical protein
MACPSLCREDAADKFVVMLYTGMPDSEGEVYGYRDRILAGYDVEQTMDGQALVGENRGENGENRGRTATVF